MKMNMLAARLSVVALCATTLALATPAHAQWQETSVVISPAQAGFVNPVKIADTSQYGPTTTPPSTANNVLTVKAGGTGNGGIGGTPNSAPGGSRPNSARPFNSGSADSSYNCYFTVKYVWQGTGTPTTSFTATRTDNFTAHATGSGIGYSAGASAMFVGGAQSESASAHSDYQSTENVPDATAPTTPINTTVTPTITSVTDANGTTTTGTFMVEVNAEADGTVPAGSSFNSTASASVTYK